MDIEQQFVHLARFALGGQVNNISMTVRQVLPIIQKNRPDLSDIIAPLLERSPAKPIRGKLMKESVPLPIDVDSRLELLRQDSHPILPVIPTWPPAVASILTQFVEERRLEVELMESGITPTRSLLFVGPPGVGKSLAASQLAVDLELPLLTLDLAAVMSSFLGRTGNNIRAVLDYARGMRSVLLLDEFDAIAKRRDDSAEVGELKRLVTVLLQAIDDWPSDGILIATTNHPDLLDPAVWRRFECIIEFPVPAKAEILESIRGILQNDAASVSHETIAILASLFEGRSFADVRKSILSARREAFVKKVGIDQVLKDLIPTLLDHKSHAEKIALAVTLLHLGWPERRISQITGIARETFRKRVDKELRRTVKR